MNEGIMMWISLIVASFSVIPEGKRLAEEPHPGDILVMELKVLFFGLATFFILRTLFYPYADHCENLIRAVFK